MLLRKANQRIIRVVPVIKQKWRLLKINDHLQERSAGNRIGRIVDRHGKSCRTALRHHLGHGKQGTQK